MIKEITTKTLLNHVKQPDTWFGLRYNLNLYRGCQHQCIYCDSRSDCYRIENFADILVKTNAIEVLQDELPRKRNKGTIGFGSMNDPYMPIEKERELTKKALEAIQKNRFPVHILTKSALVTRDIDVLKKIAEQYAAVSFTVTTADDDLCKKLEPGAPVASERFAAMKELHKNGIYTGILLMPVLPFIEDTRDNVKAIVEAAAESGASYILPWFGMSIRSGQREYFYAKLDELFPGIREKYELRFGEQYQCDVPNAKELYQYFDELCKKCGITKKIEVYEEKSEQRKLF
ncbi:MAG TPA: radical SAM protein [Candidatus Cloacimonetes bacterium]|nr:radical SAM protein [Candidatus Cloacimonadota bacterium]HEX38042.1 radical SAM protein [Candidatus Cloacimonadota bacterium]